jgi:hypothetical protein
VDASHMRKDVDIKILEFKVYHVQTFIANNQ